MNINKSKVLMELNALIKQAWGEDTHEGCAIKCDPALARNLEWIRSCYESLYSDADGFDEDE